MITDRIECIREALQRELQPEQLEIIDDSWKHAGHAGAASHGGGHFRVMIRASIFRGKSRLACHRMVMDTLKENFQNDIHALSIHTEAPENFV